MTATPCTMHGICMGKKAEAQAKTGINKERHQRTPFSIIYFNRKDTAQKLGWTPLLSGRKQRKLLFMQ